METSDTSVSDQATGSPTWTRPSLIWGASMAGIGFMLVVAVIVLQMAAALGWIIGQSSLHPWTDVLARIGVAAALIASLLLLFVTPSLAVVV